MGSCVFWRSWALIWVSSDVVGLEGTTKPRFVSALSPAASASQIKGARSSNSCFLRAKRWVLPPRPVLTAPSRPRFSLAWFADGKGASPRCSSGEHGGLAASPVSPAGAGVTLGALWGHQRDQGHTGEGQTSAQPGGPARSHLFSLNN